MTLQRISLPKQELQTPLSKPEDARPRSLVQQQPTADLRYFKYDFCHRTDTYEEDRVSVLLCGGVGINHTEFSVYGLLDCYQQNLTVESYLNVAGHYERQQRAWVECDLRDESKQTFCTLCPEPNASSVRPMYDDSICNVAEDGCLQPYVMNFKPESASVVRCGTNGTIVVYDFGEDDADGWPLDAFMASCDGENDHFNWYQMDHGLSTDFYFPIHNEGQEFMECVRFDSDGACPGFCHLVESTSLASQFIGTYYFEEEEVTSARTGSIDLLDKTHSSYLVGGDVLVLLLGCFVIGFAGMLVRTQRSRQHEHSSMRRPRGGGGDTSDIRFVLPSCEYQMVELGEEVPSRQQQPVAITT
eukprot:Nitzschia sp. Nitz4//scaffold434_size7771//371//1444//NITZ4_009150-RA/size7771-processed-gene-0.0-mRNA-1//1//CDS//3329551828//6532//frame0